MEVVLGPIVAAVDGAECSGAVLALAVDLARRHACRLTGLFVVDGGWPDFIGNDWQSAMGARQGFLDHIHREQEDQARAAAAQFAGATAGLADAVFETVGGDPIEVLIARARDTGTGLVVASRRSFSVSGRPSLERLGQRLAAKATRPILLLP